MKTKTMALALVCADGRLHQDGVHYNRQLAEAISVDAVDLFAVPGPDGLFKPGREDERAVALKQIRLLIAAHHPIAIAVAGHYNCAGNAVEDAEHDADVQAAAQQFKQELDFAGPVSAISTVRHSDSEWSLKKIGL